MVRPDELDAMIESGGVAASMSANNLILKSDRSGPFSWTRSAADNASFISGVKVSLSREAFFASPMAVRSGHAESTYLRRFSSAFGAGSVAITSRPHARYCAAQLAPMAPVPTMAISRIGLSESMFRFLLERNCASTWLAFFAVGARPPKLVLRHLHASSPSSFCTCFSSAVAGWFPAST
jgi:hypothetical protein